MCARVLARFYCTSALLNVVTLTIHPFKCGNGYGLD